MAKVVLKKYQENAKPVFSRLGKIKKGEVSVKGIGKNLTNELRIHPEPAYEKQLKSINPNLRFESVMAVVANDDPLQIANVTYNSTKKIQRICDGETILKERGDKKVLEDVNKPCQMDGDGICQLCSGKSKGVLVPVKPESKLDVVLEPPYAFGYFELMSSSKEVDQPKMVNLVETLRLISAQTGKPITAIPFEIKRVFDPDFMGRYEKDGKYIQSANPQWFLDFQVDSRVMQAVLTDALSGKLFLNQATTVNALPESKPQLESPKVPENFTKFSGIINKIKETPDKVIYANVEEIYPEFDWVGATKDAMNDLFQGYKVTYLEGK